jgi:hypothetical protein
MAACLRSTPHEFRQVNSRNAVRCSCCLDDPDLGRALRPDFYLPENSKSFSGDLYTRRDWLRSQERHHGSQNQNGRTPNHGKEYGTRSCCNQDKIDRCQRNY